MNTIRSTAAFSRHLLVPALLALSAAATSPPMVRAQASRLPSRLGTDIYRCVLHDSGLKPLRELKELEQLPEDKVLIVFGETDVLDKVPGGLVRFIQNGGAALVATDRQTSREKGKALEPFGVWVDGRLVSAPFQDNYKGLEECVSIE